MEKKMCTVCNIEKNINNFYKKFSDCKDCKRARGLKRYNSKKDKISNQQKNIMDKIEINYYRNKMTTEIKNTDFKDLVRSYVELENKIKTLEENFKINDSENN